MNMKSIFCEINFLWNFFLFVQSYPAPPVMVNHLITSRSQTIQSSEHSTHNNSTPQKRSTPENLPENMRHLIISDPVNSTMSDSRSEAHHQAQFVRGLVTHGQMI